jgi:hypothetical protein
MINDVDHEGVSNAQLVKENADISVLYKHKSPAEQNSIDLAWDLLMEPSYEELRSCIFTNQADAARSRSLVVNLVIATDIFDRDLKELRNTRWEKAFGEDSNTLDKDNVYASNLKGTLLLEHVIQASDIAHIMQHWHVYINWNNFFREIHLAYISGRTELDPAAGWYKSELWFYENYIIPLARKLKQCKVFGASSEEFLDYATMNRIEWEAKGEQLVEDWIFTSSVPSF